MGELHLEVLIDRMLREFGVRANVGRPQVSYRETITRAVEHEARFVRQTGGRGQFGVVDAAAGAHAPGRGLCVREQDRRRRDSQGVYSGGRARRARGHGGGGSSGYPLVDVKAQLIDGKYHEVDSSELAFKIAGSMALREGVQRAARSSWSR